MNASDPVQNRFRVESTHLGTMLCLPPVLLREKPKKHGSERQSAPKIEKLLLEEVPKRLDTPYYKFN